MKTLGYSWTFEILINNVKKEYQVETKYANLSLACWELWYVIFGEEKDIPTIQLFLETTDIKLIKGPEPLSYPPSSFTGGSYEVW